MGTQNWDCILICGWRNKYYKRFARRSSNTCRIIYFDNQFLYLPRQVLFLFLGRKYLKNFCDYAFVPGLRSAKYASLLGFKEHEIRTGALTFNEKLFYGIKSDFKADNFFIFVGRISYEKGLKELLNSYVSYREIHTQPRDLKIVGPAGNFNLDYLPDGVEYLGALSQKDIAELFKGALALILPSTFEPFGVVALEAAAAGLPLILSSGVGSADDLIDSDNGIVVSNPLNFNLRAALCEVSSFSEDQLIISKKKSLIKVEKYLPHIWSLNLNYFVNQKSKNLFNISKDSIPTVFLNLVTPFYRMNSLKMLVGKYPEQVRLFAGTCSAVGGVKSDFSNEILREVRFVHIMSGSFSLQISHWRESLSTPCLVLDLNTRILTSWILLLFRRVRGRRTLLWGHVSHLREIGFLEKVPKWLMSRFSNGLIAYTKTEGILALEGRYHKKIYVAPNSIYSRRQIRYTKSASRKNLLYIGRLSKKKNILRLVKEFIDSGIHSDGAKMTIVGLGEQLSEIQALITSTKMSASFDLIGDNFEFETIEGLFTSTFASVSGDYAGLSITMSLGFGVPILVPDAKKHSPEIELVESGGVILYDPSDSSDFKNKIQLLYHGVDGIAPHGEYLSEFVKTNFSSESMAEGLESALLDHNCLSVEGS